MSQSALILSSALGSETFHGNHRDVPASREYNKGKVDGPGSYYVVYHEPEFDDVHDHNSNSYKIVESTTNVSFGWNVRSFHGFDTTGIAIFEHHYYCGTARNYTASTPDITSEFPPSGEDKGPGASAMIVSKGVWSLYSEKQYQGTKIQLNGKDEFGPGTRIATFGAAGDRVKSIKYIREE